MVDEQIVETILAALREEATACLRERLVKDAAQVDTLLIDTIGFPKDRSLLAGPFPMHDNA